MASKLFSKHQEPASIQKSISEFKKTFFEIPHSTQKTHIRPMNGSAAKRINMYLRWMCAKTTKELTWEYGRVFPYNSVLF
jgi:hypothetical protein